MKIVWRYRCKTVINKNKRQNKIRNWDRADFFKEKFHLRHFYIITVSISNYITEIRNLPNSV